MRRFVQALERKPQRSAAVGLRRRSLDASVRKMRHEIEIEGKLFRSEPFIEREHETPLVGGDEVVGVFDPSGNRFEAVNGASGARDSRCEQRVLSDIGADIGDHTARFQQTREEERLDRLEHAEKIDLSLDVFGKVAADETAVGQSR